MHYSDPARVEAIGNEITSHVLSSVGKHHSSTEWTKAVYNALRSVASVNGWKIHPAEKPYKGEYLCDFTLHEKGYGCRIACESQWINWRREHRAELAWAFDKLRGVKSDLKVFVFEGDDKDWNEVVAEYLENSAQILQGEAYLALQWSYDRFNMSYWIAPRSGDKQSINFQQFDSTPGHMSAYVLDKHGNNAAISCPVCAGVYIVSGLIDRVNGRKCPKCEKSLSRFEGNEILVETL